MGMSAVTMLLGCGAFLLFPLLTIVIGSLLIMRRIGLDRPLAMILEALAMGLAFAEAAFISMAIDPKASSWGIVKIIGFAGLVGIGVTIFVLIFTPLYAALMKSFRR